MSARNDGGKTRALTDVFIRHPVLAIVVNLAIVLVGWRALMILPVQQYPKIESSSVLITTIYYGASAETVRGFLTTPIERVVSAISGVDYLESTSRAGVSTVTVRLKLNHKLRRRWRRSLRVSNRCAPNCRRKQSRRSSRCNAPIGPTHLFTLALRRRSAACRRSRTGWPAPCNRSSPRCRAFCALRLKAVVPSRCASGSTPIGWPR